MQGNTNLHPEFPIFLPDFGSNFTFHPMDKLPADIQPQAAPWVLPHIAAPKKAVEYMGEFPGGKPTPRIANQHLIFFLFPAASL